MKIHLKNIISFILLNQCLGAEYDPFELDGIGQRCNLSKNVSILGPSDPTYYTLRPAFSKLYNNWPHGIMQAIPPKLNNTEKTIFTIDMKLLDEPNIWLGDIGSTIHSIRHGVGNG